MFKPLKCRDYDGSLLTLSLTKKTTSASSSVHCFHTWWCRT